MAEQDAEQEAEPRPFVWCIVANMRAGRRVGPGGIEVRPGTKQFRPGAKLYCWPPRWYSYHGMDGIDRIRVTGLPRRSHRCITIVVDAKLLTNWRVKAVYEPRIIRELTSGDRDRPGWDDSEEKRARAEELVARMRAHYPDEVARPDTAAVREAEGSATGEHADATNDAEG